MEIKKINNNWELRYKYKIITTKRKTKGKEYYYYTTSLSREITNYFNTYEYYLYKYDKKLFITTEKPEGYVYKKFKAQSKHNHSLIRAIPLNPKLCGLSGNETDKYVEIIVHLCEHDYITDDVLVELRIL